MLSAVAAVLVLRGGFVLHYVVLMSVGVKVEGSDRRFELMSGGATAALPRHCT